MTTAVRQKTVRRSGTIRGTGIHTGEQAAVTVRPASRDGGIRFLKHGKEIGRMGAHGPHLADPRLRCSFVGEGTDRILTVEHLLAACYGLGLTNAVIDVEGPEIPVLDGSSKPFVEFLNGLGLEDQGESEGFYRVQEPIFCHDGGRVICALPSEKFVVSYLLDYDHPYLRGQAVQFTVTPEIFEKEIAPARTFCTAKEAVDLKTAGFGLGATTKNTLVIPEQGFDESGLRFKDECARHKVLDIVGDLAFLGRPMLGCIIGLRSGHSLNRQLVSAIMKQKGLHG